MDRLRRHRTIITVAGTVAFASLLSSCSALAIHAVASGEQEGIVLRNLDKAGALEIQNRGPAIELSSQLKVQQFVAGRWQDLGVNVSLAETCAWQSQQSTCHTVDSGAKLRPVAWNGMSCGGQCSQSCRATVYLGPGQFRFAVNTCDRKHGFFGPSFNLLDYRHSGLKTDQK